MTSISAIIITIQHNKIKSLNAEKKKAEKETAGAEAALKSQSNLVGKIDKLNTKDDKEIWELWNEGRK